LRQDLGVGPIDPAHQDVADGASGDRHDELIDVDERDPVEALRVIDAEMLVGGELTRPVRPIDQRDIPGKAGGADQVTPASLLPLS
jgi:hypothetical protein